MSLWRTGSKPTPGFSSRSLRADWSWVALLINAGVSIVTNGQVMPVEATVRCRLDLIGLPCKALVS